MLINHAEKRKLRIRVLYQLYRLILNRTRSRIKAIYIILLIRKKYHATHGEAFLTKVARVNNKYFWRLGVPGFPSDGWIRMHEHEIDRFFDPDRPKGLRSLIFAVTKSCRMRCKHCFEWDSLNKQEKLTTDDIIQIVDKFQDYGTTQIMLSGGEPMMRLDDICEVLNAVKKNADFWIITSGFGLGAQQAEKLKAAGLSGVMVSLDHPVKQVHDEFRGYAGAYEMAVGAIEHAKTSGLITALSFCAIRSNVTREILEAYMELAKKLEVVFVQVLEPRAAGRFAGNNVTLGKREIDIIEKTYLDYNTLKSLKEYPIINYLGYHQRRVGCFGGGNRFLYIDTDGDAHICPYCRGKIANALTQTADEITGLTIKQPCHVFQNNVNF